MRVAIKSIAQSFVLGVALITGQGLAHDGHAVPVPTASKSGTQIQTAGLAFWDTLNAAQRASLAYAFKGPEAADYWSASRNDAADTLGLRLSELSQDQRKLVDDLLIASTSSQGFFKIRAAMQHERSPDVHRIAIFGSPQSGDFWSFSLNGPHLRYNVMVLNGHMVLMPVFYSVAAPTEDDTPLPQEFMRGYELMNSLTPDQQSAAVVASSVPEAKPYRFEQQGISGDQLRPDQRSLMWKLIVEYVANSDFDFAADHFERIHSGGWQNLYFMWMGPTDGTGPVIYRVSGPSILIEFAAMRAGSDEAFHPHVLIRDPNNAHGANWLVHHISQHH